MVQYFDDPFGDKDTCVYIESIKEVFLAYETHFFESDS